MSVAASSGTPSGPGSARRRDVDRPVVMWVALGIALLLHVLFAILYSLMPPRTSTASLVELREPDPILRFEFAEPDSTQDQPARGETPLDSPRNEPRSVEAQVPIELPDPSPQPPTEATSEVGPVEVDTPTPAQQAPPSPPDAPDPQTETEPNEQPDSAESDSPSESEAQPVQETDSAGQRPASDAGRGPVVDSGSAPPPASRRTLDDGLNLFRERLRRGAATRKPTSNTRNRFVPNVGDLPVQGSPYGILEFSSRDYDWSDYSRQIYERILKAWYRRIEQSTNEFERWGRERQAYDVDDSTRVDFTIQSDGDITDIYVITPSSCQPLDLSATDGLEEVLLPPLPDDFPRSSEEVKATFIMQVPVFELRRIFRYLRQIGYLD